MNFASRDPLAPAFWDERFGQRFTPWDRGGVPERLRQWVADMASSSAAPQPAAPRPAAPQPAAPQPAALIPGCGSAWELAYLSGAGWNATAIDFAPAAVAAARAAVGKPWQDRVVQADFFQYQPPAPLDLVYERAFLCALPPAMWPRVARRWAQLLRPGALLAGYFYVDDQPGGPPFGIGRDQLQALLQPAFTCEQDEPVTDSLPVFQGRERWMTWRRAPYIA